MHQGNPDLGFPHSGFSRRRHDRSRIADRVPQLVHDDILAAIAYGAEAARERIVIVPLGRVA
jgi:hypothetical protein